MDDSAAWTARAVIAEDGRMSRPTVPDEFISGCTAEAGGPPILSSAPPRIGSYDDALVKTAEGWRFAERRGRLDFQA